MSWSLDILASIWDFKTIMDCQLMIYQWIDPLFPNSLFPQKDRGFYHMDYIAAYLLRWDLRLFLAKTGFGMVSQFSFGAIQLSLRSMNSSMGGM